MSHNIHRYFLVALLAICSASSVLGRAADTCKPLSVQSLSEAEIDRIALDEISKLTRVPVTALNVNKTLKQVDRSDNDVMTYGMFLLEVEHRLGIRLALASPEIRLNLPETVGEAYERTAIITLTAIVRSAFRNTPNCGN